MSSAAEQEILEIEARAHLPREVREMLAAVAPLCDVPPPALELRVRGHKALRCDQALTLTLTTEP